MACSSPILIDNPNLINKSRWGRRQYVDKFGDFIDKKVVVNSRSVVSRFKDDHYKLKVPCGWCPECVRLRQLYLVQRSQGESIVGNDFFFLTFTYQNSYIPTVDIGDKRYYYARYEDVRHMINRIRVNHLLPFEFKYMFVSEYGGKRRRPHFHMLLSIPPQSPRETRADKESRALLLHKVFLSEWRRNVGSSRSPIWQPLCRYIVSPDGHRTFDCHYVDPATSPGGTMDVSFYVTKYCLKPDKNLRKLQSWLKLNLPYEEYRYYWSILSPRVWFSKEYGSPYHPVVQAHLRKSVEYSIVDGSLFPYWLNTANSKTFPLAPYYRDRFFNGILKKELSKKYDPSLFIRWFDSRHSWLMSEIDERTPEDFYRSESSHNRRMKSIMERDLIDFFPEI